MVVGCSGINSSRAILRVLILHPEWSRNVFPQHYAFVISGFFP